MCQVFFGGFFNSQFRREPGFWDKPRMTKIWRRNDKIMIAFGQSRAAECRPYGIVNDAYVGAAFCRPPLAGAKFSNYESQVFWFEFWCFRGAGDIYIFVVHYIIENKSHGA
jgi:hypothetical protein